MIFSEVLNSLTQDQYSLLEYILIEKSPKISVEINENTIKSYKYDKLAENIFKARDFLNMDNLEGLDVYNELCDIFKIEKINIPEKPKILEENKEQIIKNNLTE